MWLYTIDYRLGQVRQQFGFLAPLSVADYTEAACWLPPSALSLFKTMSSADQQHSLRVCRGLLDRGCKDKDMLAAALLHDVGKAQGRVPFWTRPVIVLGKRLAPRLLRRLVVYPDMDMSVGAQFIAPSSRSTPNEKGALPVLPLPRRGCQTGWNCAPTHYVLPRWRRSLSYAWYHAEVGAELAAAAGLSVRAVLYIRTHHQPDGPAAPLHAVDEVS